MRDVGRNTAASGVRTGTTGTNGRAQYGEDDLKSSTAFHRCFAARLPTVVRVFDDAGNERHRSSCASQTKGEEATSMGFIKRFLKNVLREEQKTVPNTGNSFHSVGYDALCSAF